jgi:hypothetical protein
MAAFFNDLRLSIRQFLKNPGLIGLALGAAPGSLVRMIIGQELKPIVTGLTAGILSARGLARLICSLLFETRTHDPVTLAASAFASGVPGLPGLLFAGSILISGSNENSSNITSRPKLKINIKELRGK